MVLVVNLEEFADLVGRTAETMKQHLRQLEPQPTWLIERGDRGRGYKIDAEGGVAWWQEKIAADELADEDRRNRLAQLRLDLVGDRGEEAERLILSGRQRREEYEAAFKGLEYRKRMGELVEKAELDHVLTGAAVELRRRLSMVPGQFAISSGIPIEQVKPLETLLAAAIDQFLAAIEGGDAAA